MKNKIFVEDLEQINNQIDRVKFKNATILITGCAGFLGYYILNYFTKYFEELNLEKIIGLDTFILSKPKWINDLIAKNKGKLDIYTFDIAKDKIENIKNSEKVNYVIHMASIASPSFYRRISTCHIRCKYLGIEAIT